MSAVLARRASAAWALGRGWSRAVAAAAVTLTAAVQLDERPLDYDGALSVRAAVDPIGGAARLVAGREAFQAVYYLVLRGWCGVLGTGPVAVHGLSVALFVVTAGLVFALGSRIRGPGTGAVAVVLLCTQAGWVAAVGSGAVRLATALVAGAALAAVGAQRTRSVRAVVVGTVLVVLACYCAPTGLAFLLGWGWLVRRCLGWAPVRALFVTAAVAVAPLAAFLLAGRAAYSTWLGAATAQQDLVARAADTLAGGGPSWRAPAAIVAMLVLVAGLSRRVALRRTPVGSVELLVLGGWVALPLAVAVGVGLITPVTTPALLLPVVPAGALLVAAALADLRPAASALVVLALLATSLPALGAALSAAKPPWDGVAAVIVAGAADGDRVRAPDPTVALPLAHALRGHPGLLAPPLAGLDLGGGRPPTAAPQAPGRLWVVTVAGHDSPPPADRALLTRVRVGTATVSEFGAAS